MIPERFRTIWGTRTFSTPCATRRWRRTDLKTSGRIKCSAGYGVGSEILRKSKCKNHRNNACKVTRHGQAGMTGEFLDVPETAPDLRDFARSAGNEGAAARVRRAAVHLQGGIQPVEPQAHSGGG